MLLQGGGVRVVRKYTKVVSSSIGCAYGEICGTIPVYIAIASKIRRRQLLVAIADMSLLLYHLQRTLVRRRYSSSSCPSIQYL